MYKVGRSFAITSASFEGQEIGEITLRTPKQPAGAHETKVAIEEKASKNRKRQMQVCIWRC